MQKLILLSGTISSGLAVLIGAFGAHGLQKILETNNRLNTFETGVKYHFYHALALLFLGIYMNHCTNKELLNISAFCNMVVPGPPRLKQADFVRYAMRLAKVV